MDADIQVSTCNCIFTCSYTFTTHTDVRAHTHKGAKALPQDPPPDTALTRADAEGAETNTQQPEVPTKQDCDVADASSTSSQHAVRPLKQTTGLSVNVMRALTACLSSSMPAPIFTLNPYLLLLPTLTFCLDYTLFARSTNGVSTNGSGQEPCLFSKGPKSSPGL